MTSGRLNAHKRENRRRRLYKVQGGVCLLCAGPMTLQDASFEHLSPLSCGGRRRALGNLALSHFRCNRVRGTRDLTEDQAARLKAWYGDRPEHPLEQTKSLTYRLKLG